MRDFLAFMLRMFLDQRGEVGNDDSVEEVQDEDIIEEEDVVVIDPDEAEEDEDSDKESDKKKDKEPDEKSEQIDLKAELDKRDSKLKEYEKQIKDNNRNFYNMRKKFEALEKKAVEKDVQFSDEQIKTMLDEHSNDPDAMLSIIRHVAKQEATSEAKSQVDATEISKRKKEMDDYLITTFPDVHSEGSKDHKDIQNAKKYLHLEDHPLGDSLAAMATMGLQLPDLIEDAKKEARESALKLESNRKKSIKETKVADSKKKVVSTEGTKDQLAVAKQMGLSKSATKHYLKLVNPKNKSASVEV